ncbi:hypothetical protein J416_00424 [Gracilibacillus halophilus YIM-C55.5]|uniref:Anti-sigma factor RsgI-like middle domain-containing protein n=1 Tax=Gracilibacillus halophilus YIM-C55.5 TaxID=1308866 RepID=N4WZE9_9BACI|nr:hypothetical protein [Gracilibacillus halophilus]ENH98406.1 hypothetical protein J416_00424 [Gracilibacillus halophilus YIM-C55.5]
MRGHDITGTVVDVGEKQIVLLDDDGSFHNVPRPNHSFPLIGERYMHKVKRTPIMSFSKWGISVASFAVILFVAFMQWPFVDRDHEPAYLLAVDINPSIELQLNQEFEVIDVSGVNQDGKKIIEEMTFNHRNIDQAIEQVVEQLKQSGYLSSDQKAHITATWVHLAEEEKTTEPEIDQMFSEALHDHQVSAKVETLKQSEKDYQELKEQRLMKQAVEENDTEKQNVSDEDEESQDEDAQSEPSKNKRAQTDPLQNKPAQSESSQNERTQSEKNTPTKPVKENQKEEKAESKNQSDKKKKNDRGKPVNKLDPPKKDQPKRGNPPVENKAEDQSAEEQSNQPEPSNKQNPKKKKDNQQIEKSPKDAKGKQKSEKAKNKPERSQKN